MNASEEATVAPLLGVEAGYKTAAQDRAFRLQGQKRGVESVRLEAERRGERRLRRRAKAFEPAADDFDERLIRRRRDSRLQLGVRPDRLDLVEAFSRDPERRLRRFQPRCTLGVGERFKPAGPVARSFGLLLGQAAEP